MKKRPIVLCIMDGYGLTDRVDGNAVKLANTPNLDDLMAMYPTTTIKACGNAVGLPEGQMGNSEVGHMNIGAGRTVYQSLTLINKAITEGTFFTNEKFVEAVENAKKNDSKLHIWGLLSSGGVHSSNEHIYALLKLAKDAGLTKVYVHAFLDGRDVAPDSAVDFVGELAEEMKKIGVGEIASISGRYYAMDRDKRFDRINLAYEAIVDHKGNSFTDPVQFVKDSYAEEVFDEFVVPGYNSAVDGAVEDYESVQFEGFGPSGSTVIVKCLTDNKNRTASNVKNAFTKGSGNVGTPGCVSFMFDEKGQIIIDKEECDMDSDDLMMTVLDAGAEDFNEEEDSYEVLTAPEDFSDVRLKMEEAGIPMVSAEVTMIPQTYVDLTKEEDIKNIQKTLDLLDEDDDVQDVYHNWNE